MPGVRRSQPGLCAICRDAPAEHVDHDHATDRTDLMIRAAAYVNRDPDVSMHAFVVGGAGIFIGDLSDPRPPGEPRIA